MKALDFLLRLVRRGPRYFMLCVLFATLELFVLPIAIGVASQAFFDALAGGAGTWVAIVALVAAQVAEVWIGPLLGNPWNSLQQQAQVNMQHSLLGAVLRGFGRRGLPMAIGEALSRFRDEPRVISDGLDALCDLIGRTFFAVVAIYLMWRINAAMTIVLLVPLALSAWASEVLGTRTMTYRSASQSATSRVTGFLGELLSGHLAVSVGGAVPHAVNRLRQLGDARRRMAVRDGVFGVMLDSFSVNLGHFATGLVLLMGAHAIADGSFSVGDFALYVVYLDQLIWYPAEIARVISDLKRIDVSVERMTALVPGDPPQVLVAAARVHRPRVEVADRLECLELRNVSCMYPHSGRGIMDVTLTLRRGSFTVITGRIGSGKSTLLHVLLGLLPLASGEIVWNGRRVEDAAEFFVPPRSAFTPQVPRLFSETLRDNLLLGRFAPAHALEAAIHASVLGDDVRTLEHGLETVVGPRGVKLSGGQVQRAALARMFMADAELLVFDDVSSALDTATESELWARLFARGPEVTCLVVSHRPAALMRADQVLVLEAGRVVQTTAERLARLHATQYIQAYAEPNRALRD